MSIESFPYTIPKTGKPISSQEDLISDLTISSSHSELVVDFVL